MNSAYALAALRCLVSVRRSPAWQATARGILAVLLRVGCAALLAWIGYIHLHLWQEGYRQIPTDGPFFLLDAIVAFVFAAVLLTWPRPLAGLLAAGFTASTIGALVISLSVGLFGFHESMSASYVVESLVIESVAVIALLGWTVLVATSLPDWPGRQGRTSGPPVAGSAAGESLRGAGR